LRDRLRDADPADRDDLMAALVREQVGAVLRCDPARVAPRRGFFDQGMDSLLAMELTRRLEVALGWRLRATVTFEFPTADGLGRHLLERWISETRRSQEPPAPAIGGVLGGNPVLTATAVEDIRKLTPHELEALIDAEVDSLLP
jgi:polyketide synthase 12/myxalamid-type polyketide synthase MxaF